MSQIDSSSKHNFDGTLFVYIFWGPAILFKHEIFKFDIPTPNFVGTSFRVYRLYMFYNYYMTLI
jgi:hypothetical protein